MKGLAEKDLKLFREKARAFRQSVKVPLNKLQYEELPNNPRQFDESNAARLLNIFQKTGCYPRESDNHVPVLISSADLPELPRNSDSDLPLLDPDHSLIYLHGRHRIEAARRFLSLSGNDR